MRATPSKQAVAGSIMKYVTSSSMRRGYNHDLISLSQFSTCRAACTPSFS